MQQLHRWRQQRRRSSAGAPPDSSPDPGLPSLRVVPLGGLGEIGKNMMALECGDDIVVIDAGVMFPEDDMPGVDLVLPDASYLLERAEKVRAILITHGHEDHTGALPYVLPRLNVPVYAPPLALGLIQVKLKEHRLLSQSRLHQISPGKTLRLGSFQVEFFRVCHSIPDAMGLIIRTPLGTVVHTGDFKMDHTPVDGVPTDFTRLAQLSTEGVFLLLSDSTYVEIPGYTPSEAVVSEALDRIIGEAPGRVMVATFASLISRVQQVINAAHKHGRKVALVGKSMVSNAEMAIKMGYLSSPPGVLLPMGDIKAFPPEQVVLVTTGSQGEPTSALVRIANKQHRDIEVLPGDTVVVSASPIPGNEVVISRTIDNLTRQGARVLHSRNALVHVHGHAAQEELKLMLGLVRPRYFVPVHGEYRHLVAHAQLARSLGAVKGEAFVLEDGAVLELTSEYGEIVQRLGYGHVFVTGGRLRDPHSQALEERQRLAQEGVVVVMLCVDRRGRVLPRKPELVSSGVLEPREREALLAQGAQTVLEAVAQQPDGPQDWDVLSARVKESLGRFLYNETGQRPTILPVAVEV
jgi:ribonuclease J